MTRGKLLYAQAGGVTAVINASAAAVIEAARARASEHGGVLAARNGVLGLLAEELVDTAALDVDDLALLRQTPGGYFGSCRFDLDDPQTNPRQFDRIFEVLAAHDVGAFLYNGGNGSMDAVLKLSQAARERGYPLVCVGVPKTVDNDLLETDCCPGFGSAAKYIATAMLEAGRDVEAMASRRGRVFVMEVMGRNAGWLAAASALAARNPDEAPHIVLLPELPFDEGRFLRKVKACVTRLGYCAITAAEGIRTADGRALMEQGRDALGHVQLGGVGQWLARLIHRHLAYKHHWAVPDYLQRAAGHLASATDLAQAEAVGRAAVDCALDGRDAVMPAIHRLGDAPYRWEVRPVGLEGIANLERQLPPGFIAEDGFGISAAGRRYFAPLIEGEPAVRYAAGLPLHLTRRLPLLPRRLGGYAA
jgi:6-phosphofructokinase 1